MVSALIFAGGTGKRMNSCSRPKQFLEMHGKPVIIYTLEHFEYHDKIDSIIIVCIDEWIRELHELLKRYGISKVIQIVPGGVTAHDSIYNGLKAMDGIIGKNDIILIHDGVRPFITKNLISANIEAVEKYGNAITAEAVKESIIQSKDGENIDGVPNRNEMFIAKAPQSFYYGKIMELYKKARTDKIKTVDSSHLCSLYQEHMHIVKSTPNNIKITEPVDFYIYRALYEAMEGQHIF